MANKTYNSPLFLTGGMTIQDGDIYIPVSKEGRLGTGEIYSTFAQWLADPDVQENLQTTYQGKSADDILGMNISGFEQDKPSTWESLLE